MITPWELLSRVVVSNIISSTRALIISSGVEMFSTNSCSII